MKPSSSEASGYEILTGSDVPPGVFTVEINGEKNSFNNTSGEWDKKATGSIKWTTTETNKSNLAVYSQDGNFDWKSYTCAFKSDDGSIDVTSKGSKPSEPKF